MLITKAKAPSPGILNKKLMMGLKTAPIKFTTPRPISISTHMKKGSSAGHTTLNHRFRPSKEDLYAYSGNIIMQITIKRNIIEFSNIEGYFFCISSPKNNGNILYLDNLIVYIYFNYKEEGEQNDK